MQRRDAIKTGFSLVGLLAASSFIYKEYANAKPVLKLRPPAALDEDEFLNVEKIKFQKLVDMCLSGEIKDAKTICAVMKADKLLNK